MYIQTPLEEIKTEEVHTQMGKYEKEQGVWTRWTTDGDSEGARTRRRKMDGKSA